VLDEMMQTYLDQDCRQQNENDIPCKNDVAENEPRIKVEIY